MIIPAIQFLQKPSRELPMPRLSSTIIGLSDYGGRRDPLPAGQKEVAEVSYGLLLLGGNVKPILNGQFTIDQILETITSADIWHYSGHGEMTKEGPHLIFPFANEVKKFGTKELFGVKLKSIFP